ncbi:MAG: ABC transporter ATP-binding protein [Clostridia bacterium]|nr:ABC transporter ATP-binding protein [Clostridia bacterium]
MIKITNLTKSFDGKVVLDKLNCTIKTGTIYGLIGANGAGKSTLMRIITGIYQKDSGSVEVDGKEFLDEEEIKQKFAYVPDDLFFFKNYTIKDTLQFYNKIYKNFDIDYARKMVRTLNLNELQRIETFSKGMKRQTAIICALATNAEYMFFDETFDGIDPVVRNFIKKAIAEKMEEKGCTIVVSSHNLRELEDICDNLGLLYKGGILFESEIDSLKTNMFKIQISLKNDFSKDDFKNFNVLSFKKSGSVATVILEGDREKYEEELNKMNPVILDFLPLTLEEIFIYQMEVLGYEFNQVI